MGMFQCAKTLRTLTPPAAIKGGVEPIAVLRSTQALEPPDRSLELPNPPSLLPDANPIALRGLGRLGSGRRVEP